ncbi:coiled-coil domain-containing protein 63 [Lissotriton helveticus]
MAKQRTKAKERELDMQAEIEMRRVQQQFRVMEENHKSYTDKIQLILQQHKEEYDALNEEHGSMTFAINLTTSPRNMAKDVVNVVELRDLLERKDKIDAEIEELRALLARLDAQIMELEDKVKKQKRLMSASKSAQETLKKHKRIRNLENQLNLTTVNFDIMLTKNARLRTLIEDYRLQRAAFSRYYRRLLRELNQHKAVMTNAIETSSRAFEQSSEAGARIAAIKERHAKEIAMYHIELTELIRNLDHEKKLKDFMRIKTSERLEFGEPEIRRKREALAAEKERKEKFDLFESYQAVYDQLVTGSGYEDVNSLIDDFTKKEEKNFSTFTYLNEMHQEVDRLYFKIKDVAMDLTNLQTEQRLTDEGKRSTLKESEAKLEKITVDANRYEKQYKESSKALDQLMLSIEHLFKAIDCDPAVINRLLGVSEGITHATMMLYFSVIEEKANELLRIQAFQRLKDLEEPDMADASLNPFLGAAGLLKVTPPAKFSLPIIVDEAEPEETDDTEVPYEREALRQRLLQNIIQMEHGKDIEVPKVESKHARRRAVVTE